MLKSTKRSMRTRLLKRGTMKVSQQKKMLMTERMLMLKRMMMKMMKMMNRQVDIDLGPVPSSEEESKGKAKLVIVLGDQEWREPVYLGDKTFGMEEDKEAIYGH